MKHPYACACFFFFLFFFFSLVQTEHWSRACISWLAPRWHSCFIITGPFSGRQLTSNTQTHLCTCSLWPLQPGASLFTLLIRLITTLFAPPTSIFLKLFMSCTQRPQHHANGCSGQTIHFIARLQGNMQLKIMDSLPSLTNTICTKKPKKKTNVPFWKHNSWFFIIIQLKGNLVSLVCAANWVCPPLQCVLFIQLKL